MAAIDSLLALVDAQQATGVVLRAREPPALIGGKGRGLTMPPMLPAMLETFVAEVLSPEELEKLRASGACDTSYRSGPSGAFLVEVRLNAGVMALKLRRGGAAGAKAPAAPAPAVHAPPAPAVHAPPAPAVHAPPVPEAPAARAPASAPAAPEPAASDDAVAAPGAPAPADLALAARLGAAIARAASPHDVSDVVVSAGQPLWRRSAAGFAAATASPVIGEGEIRAFVEALLDPARRRQLASAGSVDVPWIAPASDGADDEDDDGGGGDGARRFRANVFAQAQGLAVALRPIGRRAPSLAELNLPESLGALTSANGGLVLVVGPTGAGKSTTLAALLERVNRTRACHVITLEDPIELVHRPRRSLIHQREVGTHLESFAAGLRAALRECPDIILVGEMRDRETAAMALTAAETGHLVLSTLHSGGAAMAIDRLVDIFPEHQQAQIRHQLAGSLRAVLTQQLVAGTSPGARYPAVELLTVNYAVAALIRDGKTHQLATQIQTGREDGMITLESSLLDLLRAGRISREAAVTAARDPAELQRRLREAGH